MLFHCKGALEEIIERILQDFVRSDPTGFCKDPKRQ